MLLLTDGFSRCNDSFDLLMGFSMCNDSGGFDLRMSFQGIMIADALAYG